MMLAASTLGTIGITVVAFLLILMLLVAGLLFTKQKLSPSGPVTLTINGEKKIEVASGSTHDFRKSKSILAICMWWWWNLYSM